MPDPLVARLLHHLVHQQLLRAKEWRRGRKGDREGERAMGQRVGERRNGAIEEDAGSCFCTPSLPPPLHHSFTLDSSFSRPGWGPLPGRPTRSVLSSCSGCGSGGEGREGEMEERERAK